MSNITVETPTADAQPSQPEAKRKKATKGAKPAKKAKATKKAKPTKKMKGVKPAAERTNKKAEVIAIRRL
jgi:hypothetical protein